MKINNINNNLKKYFFISLLLISQNISAQITINSYDFPNGGDTSLVSKSVQFTDVDFNTTGANQTWNFSFLEANTQSVVDFFSLNSASVLYQLSFNNMFTAPDYNSDYYQNLTSNTLPEIPGGAITIENPVYFTKNSSSKSEIVGIGMDVNSVEVPVKFDTIDIAYQFPLNFNDSWNSRSYFLMDINPIYDAQLKRHQQRVALVDGWGEITTPFGTFDAVRVKTVLTYQDSVYADPLGIGAAWFQLPTPETTEYTWLTNNNKVPVLKISVQAGVATTIEYRDHLVTNFTSISNSKSNSFFNIYPNPTSDKITISIKNNNVNSLKIYDLKGKTIYSKKIIKNHTIDINNWSKGTYFVNLTSGKEINTKTFIVQ